MVYAENSFAKLSRFEQELAAGESALLAAEHGPGIGAGHGLGALGNGRRSPRWGTRGRAGLFDARASRTTTRRAQQRNEHCQRALDAREAWESHAACACS
jgi:hypothetical protein